MRRDRHTVPVDRVVRGQRVADDREPVGPAPRTLVVVAAVHGGPGEGDAGQRLGAREELPDHGMAQLLRGEPLEVALVGGRFAPSRARQHDHPAPVLDGQQKARPAGAPLARVGLHIDDGEAFPRALGSEVHPTGVRQAGVDLALLRCGEAECRQPLRCAGASSGGVDDQVGRQDGLVACGAADADSGDSGGGSFEAERLGTLDELDPVVAEDQRTDDRVEQVTADQDHVVGLVPATEPALGRQHDHVRRDREVAGAGFREPSGDTRQEFLDRPGTAGPQGVRVLGLGQVLAALGALGQGVPLDDRDDVRELGQGAGREHAGEAAAEDDGGSQGPCYGRSFTQGVALMWLARSLLRRSRARGPP